MKYKTQAIKLISSSAKFSECGKYRYSLERVWDERKPKAAFIGLNPSTANGSENDATIRKVMRFAYQWGYGGVIMLNLFPFISTDPDKLETDHNAEAEEENTRAIKEAEKASTMIFFAWGSFYVAKERGAAMAKNHPFAYCLIKNIDGSPRHPLYVPYKTEPKRFYTAKEMAEALIDKCMKNGLTRSEAVRDTRHHVYNHEIGMLNEYPSSTGEPEKFWSDVAEILTEELTKKKQ